MLPWNLRILWLCYPPKIFSLRSHKYRWFHHSSAHEFDSYLQPPIFCLPSPRLLQAHLQKSIMHSSSFRAPAIFLSSEIWLVFWSRASFWRTYITGCNQFACFKRMAFGLLTKGNQLKFPLEETEGLVRTPLASPSNFSSSVILHTYSHRKL